MRAQVLTGPGELQFMDIPVPVYNSEEFLVKIEKACICNGSDPAILYGSHGRNYPMVFGHEACGVIIACGEDVKGYRVGEKISWWFKTGAFAEYISINPDKIAVVKLPESAGIDEGPLFELVGASARAVEAAGDLSGKRILIIGMGPSGLLMSQWAKHSGASEVIGWDLYQMRRETGLRLSFDKVFDDNDDKIVETTLGLAGEADVIIDAFPDDVLKGRNTLNNAIRTLRKGGLVICYGQPENGRAIDVKALQNKSAAIKVPINDIDAIRGFYGKATAMYNRGELSLKPLITGRVWLENILDGIGMVVDYPNRNLKILVDI